MSSSLPLLVAGRFARRAGRQGHQICRFSYQSRLIPVMATNDIPTEWGFEEKTVDGSWFSNGINDSRVQRQIRSHSVVGGRATVGGREENFTPASLVNFANRHGRIHLEDLMAVVHKAEAATPYPFNRAEEVFLLQSCGNLLAMEPPDSRQLAVERVVQLIKTRSKLTVEHYNALLATHISNGHLFSPLEVISSLKAEGQSPDDRTYQLLVERYCQEGELEAASVVMSRMQQTGMSVNERVFNALIFCNLKMRDFSGAASMMEVMAKRGLPLNSSTYATIVRGYAVNGDLDKLQQAILEAKNKGIRLSDDDLLDAVVSAASANQPSIVSPILQLLPRDFGFGLKCVNVTFRLAASGKYQEALDVVAVVPSKQNKTAPDSQSGTYFFNFILEKMKPSIIIKVAAMMEDRKVFNNALLEAVKFLLRRTRVDDAKQVLIAYEKSGKQLRSQMFWPFLKSALHGKNLEEFGATLQWMTRCCPGESLSLDTAASMVVEDFVTNFGVQLNRLSKECENEGLRRLNYRFWLNSYVILCLRSHRLQSLLTALQSQSELISVNDLWPKVSDQFVALLEMETSASQHKSTAIKTLIAAMKTLHDDNFRQRNGSFEDVNGKILASISHRLPDEPQMVAEFAEQMLKNKLYISDEYGQQIMRCWSDQVPDGLASIIESLTKFMPAAATDSRSKPAPLIMNELVEQFHELCRDCKTVEAEQLYAQLKSSPSAPRYLDTLLCNMYVKCGDVEKGLQIAQNANLSVVASIRLATLLFDKQQNAEGLEVLGSLASYGVQEYFNAKPLVPLLECVARQDDGQQLFYQILQLFKAKGYSVGAKCRGILLRHYLGKDDLVGAKKEMETIMQPPSEGISTFGPLYREFIAAQDTVRLENLFNLQSEQCGQERAVFDLGSAFCEMEDSSKAQQLFDRSKARLSRDLLAQKMEFYFAAKNLKALEGLVRATVHVNFSRNSAYRYLFELYAKVNDWRSAYNTLVHIKETEDLALDSANIGVLNRLFRSNNQSPPFPLDSHKREPTVFSQIRSLLDEGDCVKALELVRRAGVSEFSTRLRVVIDFISQELIAKGRCDQAIDLVELFVREDIRFPFGCLFSLCDSLTQDNNLAALQKLTTLLSPVDAKRCFLENRIWAAQVHSLSGSDLLARLRNNPKKDLPVENFKLMLEKQPDLLEPLITLAHSQMHEGLNQNLIRLWEYLMLTDRDRADRLLQNELRIDDIPDFSLCRTAKDLNDESLLRLYMEQNLFVRHPEMPYSYLIGIKLEKKDLTGATEVVAEAEGKGIDKSSLNPKVLYFLQRRLKEAKKPFSSLKTDYPAEQTTPLKSVLDGESHNSRLGMSS